MPKAKIEKLTPDEFLARKDAFYSALEKGEMTIGEATKSMRQLLGMTQSEYAEKIVGVSRKVLSQIETGNGNPRLENLEKIGKPFGLKLAFVKRKA